MPLRRHHRRGICSEPLAKAAYRLGVAWPRTSFVSPRKPIKFRPKKEWPLRNLPGQRFELHHDRRDRPQLDLDPITPPDAHAQSIAPGRRRRGYAHPHTALPPLSSEDTEVNTEIPSARS